jgi:hypothetical protein
MPRKSPPIYRLLVEAPVNGRIHKADLYAFDAKGKIIYTDRANLTEATERRRAAQRMAKKLQLEDSAKVEADLEKAWTKGVEGQRRKQQEAPSNEDRSGAPYCEQDGRICRRRYDHSGNEVLEPLCNFTAVIEAETTYDDGSGETQHCFRVVGRLWNNQPLAAVDVPAGDFAAMNWPIKHWGVRAIVSPGLGAKDHLRAAIQELSPNATRQVVYRQTGWRKIDGEWLFLHAAGAIGTNGTVTAHHIELPGNLALIALPDPPDGDNLRAAVRASLRFLDLAHERITAPILSAVYRAPLGSVDFAEHVVGPSGSFKTELAALAEQHYGPGLDSRHLPGSWSSTANALEALAFTAADTLITVDDFAPGGSQADVARFHRDADRLIRAAGNRSARMRLRSDGELRPPRPPRCLLLSTGEETPKGHSVRGRLGITEVSQGDIDPVRLTACQADARNGLYAAAMAAYLRWLAARYEELHDGLKDELDRLREEYRSKENHARTGGILADLDYGMKLFLRFAVESDAISESEAREYARRVRAGLEAMGQQQADHQVAAEPAAHFMRLVRAALASGRAHLADLDGNRPKEEPAAWGWRHQFLGWSPQGRCIGWLDGDAVYLDPEVAHAEAQKLAADQNDALSVTCQTLGKRLHERNYLTAIDIKRKRLAVRKVCQGVRQEVWHLHAKSFLAAL